MLSSIELRKQADEAYIASQWETYLKELEIMGTRTPTYFTPEFRVNLQKVIDAEFTIIDEEDETKLIEYKEIKKEDK